jgi:general L-amino acid transport system substrate-binding protein
MNFKKLTLAGAFIAASSSIAIGGTLEDVKSRGILNCGVSEGVPGFSNPDASGNWAGLDSDVCRAVAVAIFDDPEKVNFVPLASKQKILAVVTGQVDLTSRTTTWTMKRDTKEGVDFTTIVFYDGQGFMVRKNIGVTDARELQGATVCVTSGTTTELNLADFALANNIEVEAVVFEGKKEAVNAYKTGRCDALTTDSSQLAAFRTTMGNPGDHLILKELISKEPLSPLVRHGDNEWKDLVTWIVNGLITAEELGVTSANAADMAANTNNPTIQRLLGTTGEYGGYIGLENDWMLRVISKIGNYGEIFERNLGQGTPLKLKRGLNALPRDGGLLYAPAFR